MSGLGLRVEDKGLLAGGQWSVGDDGTDPRSTPCSTTLYMVLGKGCSFLGDLGSLDISGCILLELQKHTKCFASLVNILGSTTKTA